MPARVAPITRSAGSRARGGSRRQRYTTTSTGTNDTALSADTRAGPAAATGKPPPAGPLARALCTRATMKGDGESEVMAHAALTFCIHVPMLETSEAIHSARNTGCDSGVQADSAVRPSEPIFQLDIEIRGVMASSAANHITDLEADGFDGGREVRRDRPVGSELRVHPGPPPRLPGRPWNRDVRLDVDGIPRRLAPLHGGGDHQRQAADRLDGE